MTSDARFVCCLYASAAVEQIAHLWHRDRVRSVDNFKGWVDLKLNFRLKLEGLLFALSRHDAICAYLLNHVKVYVLDGTSWAYQRSHFTASKDPFGS